MNTSLNFSNIQVPLETRMRIQNWLENYLGDVPHQQGLRLQLFCSRQGHHKINSEGKFLCIAHAKAKWLKSPLIIRTKGTDCWETIAECCHVIKEQLRRKRKKIQQRRFYKPQGLRLAA